MQIYQLFKQAMDKYGIQGKELAALAGISQNHLSQFRSGNKWISPEVFAALLEAMDELAPGSRLYFCQLLANQPLQADKKTNIVEIIEAADEEEVEAALLAIGRKWKRMMQNQPISGSHNPGLDSALAV
ncbi:helix-turn-helix domain-containing protein [Anabaena sp. CCY 0017]|uniref:helix-turn-helix domain-containing protein n=1 Tax=Anabaena sp. CCY 0017 TaxID=3103866 RepID=UPI0039C6AF84